MDSLMEFKIVNTIFIAYLGIILISAAKWPYPCGLFRTLIGAKGIEVKKRRRNLLIIGLFAIVMSLAYYMPFLYS